MTDRSQLHLCLRPAWLLGSGLIAMVPAVVDLASGFLPRLWTLLALAGAALTPIAVLLTIGMLRCWEACKYLARKIDRTCPHCPFHGTPHFRCWKCLRLHEDLRPSVYGVFSVRCPCGISLPTLDSHGRMALHKVCPRCSADLLHEDFGKEPEYRIAVVGATSAGKSNLLVAAVWQLLEQFGPNNDVEVTFVNPTEEAIFRQHAAQLAKGQVVQKTAPLPFPKAFTIALRSPNGRRSLVYLYDAAGEEYQQEELLARHPVERYDGVLFVVDPFAEEGGRRGLLGVLNPVELQQANPASVGAAEILSRLVNVLERLLKVPVGGRFPLPLAVAVTKVDACGLAEWLRVKRDRLGAPHLSLSSAVYGAERYTTRVRAFLSELGLGNVVRLLEDRFARVSYFPVSVLGRGFGPLAPLLWLCYHTDALRDSDSIERAFINFNVALVRSLRGLEGGRSRAIAWGGLALLLGAVIVPFMLLPPRLFWLVGGFQFLLLTVMYGCLCYQLIRLRFRR